MIKRWATFLSLLGGALALGPLPADAACTQSRIEVGVDTLVIGGTLPVAWAISPPCDVIQTGLMLGTDATTLLPAGEPVYGVRHEYSEFLTVKESRPYWIAAYARDEEGALIQSAPQVVFVAIPPTDAPRSSQALPPPLPLDDPPLTFTDDDFLVQAGNPHFASLRRFDGLSQSQESFENFSGSSPKM